MVHLIVEYFIHFSDRLNACCATVDIVLIVMVYILRLFTEP